MNLPIDLKTRIYTHIGNVQRHLGESPADEKREILQSLEAHIHDALESRSAGNPSIDLLEAIIAEMDPPESYGPATPLIAPKNRDSLTPVQKVLFFSMIAVLTCVFAFIWINDPFDSRWKEPSQPEIQEPAVP